MEPAQKKAGDKPGFAEYDYSNFYYGAGDDPLNLLTPFARWYHEALPNGYYLYSEALASAPVGPATSKHPPRDIPTKLLPSHRHRRRSFASAGSKRSPTRDWLIGLPNHPD